MKGATMSIQIVQKTELKKDIGVIGTASIITGIVIGSGIFISPKGVLVSSGSVGFTLIVWVLAGILELIEALCYAELGMKLPVTGGGYRHMKLALGNILATFSIFKSVIIGSPFSQAVVLLTFAKYTMTLLPVCGKPDMLQKLVALAALGSIVLINCYSKRLSTRIAVVTTVGKLSALFVIIAGGIYSLAKGQRSDLPSGFAGTSDDPASLAVALYSAKFAYGGANTLVVFAGEVKNPARTLPRAVLMSILTVIVVYVLTNISYLAVLTRDELISAPAVAVEFGNRALSSVAVFIPIAVMVSTFGAANNMVFSGARLIFAAGKDRNAPDFLSYLSVDKCTPLCAMILTCSISAMMIMSGDAGSLIRYLGFLSSFFDTAIMVSFIVLRFTRWRHQTELLTLPLIVPVLMTLVNIYLFVAPLVISPKVEYAVIGGAFFVCSTIVYVLFIYFRLSFPFYDKLVIFLQLLLNVCPPEMPEEELHLGRKESF